MASGPNTHGSFERLFKNTLERLTLLERRLAVQSGGPKQTPGIVMGYAGATAPDGWLICDGSEVSRLQYADLFDTIGISYGDGDGVQTFNIPDLRGRVMVGHDVLQAEFDVLGETGGAKTVTLTAAQLPQHTHPLGTNGGNLGYSEAGGPTKYTAGFGVTRASNDLTSGYQTGTTGQAHDNLQPYQVLNYVIAAGAVTASLGFYPDVFYPDQPNAYPDYVS